MRPPRTRRVLHLSWHLPGHNKHPPFTHHCSPQKRQPQPRRLSTLSTLSQPLPQTHNSQEGTPDIPRDQEKARRIIFLPEALYHWKYLHDQHHNQVHNQVHLKDGGSKTLGLFQLNSNHPLCRLNIIKSFRILSIHHRTFHQGDDVFTIYFISDPAVAWAGPFRTQHSLLRSRTLFEFQFVHVLLSLYV